MEKINFEAGTIVTPAKVNEDKTITPAVWEGKTPLSPFMLNKLQENIENDQIEQNTVINELKAKTIKCLQEVETPTPVSGTSIDLNDSADAKITELKISGNSKHETREGYNKLNINIATNTTSGVTMTNNENGTYTFSGTSNASYFKALATNITITEVCIGSGIGSLKNASLIAQVRRSGASSDSYLNLQGAVFNKEDIIKQIYVQANSGATVSGTIYPMINNGTEIKPFEPYGASPSLDYPSEIECCGDNINFFDKDNANILDGCYINESKKIISSNAQSKTLYIEIQPNTTYTIQKVLSSRFAVGTFVDTPAVNVPLTNFLQDNSKTKITITSGENDNYLAVFYYHSNYDTTITPQEILNSIKIENGQGYINEVICNKNLCNFGNLQNSHIGLTNNLNENVWKISGTATSNDFVLSIGRVNFGKFKAGKYCFSWKYSGDVSLISSGGVRISLVTKINGTSTTIQNKSINTENKFTSFTLNEEAEISLGIWNTGNGNIYDIEIECQLELSETNTEIVEHQEQSYTIPTQQPIRSIEIAKNTFLRDTFIKKNNKWFERHYIARKIFDGTEAWNYTQSSTGHNRFSVVINNAKPLSALMSNIAINKLSQEYGIAFINENKTFYIYRDLTDVNDWKAYLQAQYNAGTPVYVDYILETPLDIECTEEQSTILWDIEQNAKTYDKVTHMYSTDKISSYKDVTHKKDIETLFANTLVEGV